MGKLEARWLNLDSQTLEDDGSGNLRVKLGTHFYSDGNGIQFDPESDISFNNYNVTTLADATSIDEAVNLGQLNAVSDTGPWAFLDEDIATSNTSSLETSSVDLGTYQEFRLYYNIYASSQIEIVRFTVGYQEFMWTFADLGSAASPGIDTYTSSKAIDGYLPLTSDQTNKELYSGGNLVGEIFVGVSRSTGYTYVRNSGTYLQHDGTGTPKNLHMFHSAGYNETSLTANNKFTIYSASNNANDPGSMTLISAMRGRLALFVMRSSF